MTEETDKLFKEIKKGLIDCGVYKLESTPYDITELRPCYDEWMKGAKKGKKTKKIHGIEVVEGFDG